MVWGGWKVGLVYGGIGRRSEIVLGWGWVLLRGFLSLLVTAFVTYATDPHNRPTCQLNMSVSIYSMRSVALEDSIPAAVAFSFNTWTCPSRSLSCCCARASAAVHILVTSWSQFGQLRCSGMAMKASEEVRGATSVGGAAANVIVVAMVILWVGALFQRAGGSIQGISRWYYVWLLFCGRFM